MSEGKKSAHFGTASSLVVASLIASIAAAVAAGFAVAGYAVVVACRIALGSSALAAAFIVLDISSRGLRLNSPPGRRETAELFKLFIEHSPVYTFLKDDKLRVLLLSKNYEKILGKPIDTAIGKGSDALFSPDEARRIDEVDRKVLRDGKPVDVVSEECGRFLRTVKFPIFRRGRPAFLAGFKIDITEQKTAEARALQSLREKETLIRELYHRTKNTLQVIRSMLELQVEEYPQSESARRLVKDAEDRIQAISLVHQMLYESRDLSRILIKDYVSELATLVYRSFGVSEERISLELQVDERSIALDTAVPIGLILNELMTNSMKHAFPNRRKGEIRISMAEDEAGACVLRYSDDGVGVPAGFDFYNGDTLGLKLVRSIGAQINGDVLFEANGGVACSIAFRTTEVRSSVSGPVEAVEA